jgi:hypothetical protein
MTNTSPPHASGGQHAPMPTLGEPPPDTIPQAGQATGVPPGAVPGEEGPSVPRPAAALIDIDLLTGLFLTGAFLITGRTVGRGYIGHNSVTAAFSASRSRAPSGAQGRATCA